MHSGSAYAGARYWAKGSCIQFGLQILFIIIIIIIVVVTVGAAVTTIAGSAQGCGFDAACLAKLAKTTSTCALLGGVTGSKAECDANSLCKWKAAYPLGGITMPATCIAK
jgi:hypothetical protein